MSDEREYWIDYLRGFAAVSVVIFHLNEARESDFGLYSTIVGYGWLGVPVFFLLSGYCITKSANSSPNIIYFIIRRLSRVYFPYWASLVVVILVVLFDVAAYGQNSVSVLPKSPLDVALTLALALQPISHVREINWVYWTLVYEVAFYAVIAGTLVVRNASWWILMSISAVACLQTLVVALPVPLFFLKHWGVFAIGISFASNDTQLKRWGLFALSAIAVVVSETPPAIVTTALFSFALLIDKKWKYLPRRNLWPLLGQAGAISYSLYLVHVPIGVYFGGKLLSIWTDANLSEVLIKDVVLLVLTVLAAWAMYLLVERPSLALGRAWARSTMPDHKTRAPVSS